MGVDELPAPARRRLAGVSGRAQLMDAVHVGRLGRTFGGNPLSCAAAPVALDQLKDPAFLARARARRHAPAPAPGDRRVEPPPAAASRVVALARERGLMLMAAGIHGT